MRQRSHAVTLAATLPGEKNVTPRSSIAVRRRQPFAPVASYRTTQLKKYIPVPNR